MLGDISTEWNALFAFALTVISGRALKLVDSSYSRQALRINIHNKLTLET
jgi:hypothetical protein